MPGEKRQRTKHIMVRVTPEELEAIREKAKAFGYASSTAALLRDLALGIEPTSTLDQRAILDLLRINADLGRLGGLLKHWLSAKGSDFKSAQDIRALLRALDDTQAALKKKVMAL